MAKTYDTYKDSGIAWIGEIPSEWDIKRLGNFYNPRNEKVSDKDYAPLSVTMKGIVPQLETAAKTDDGDNRKLVREGDFVINSRSDRRGSCGISALEGSVSLINIVLCPKGKMDAGFYNWLFHTSMFADEYYKWGHGIVDDLWTTRWSEMKNICVVNPSLSDQHSIATFLDTKCGEIDALISLQEEMISELQAYKQSVITEAVTKGLNPHAKMKDSGVEWIGEIPEGWNLCKIQYLSNLQSGKNLTTEQITDEGIYPVYGGNGIRGYYPEYTHDGDYVIIGRQGALCGNINYAHGKFWPTEHAVVCHPKVQYNYTWFGEVLRTMNLGQYSLASAQPGLAVERIKQLSIPVPPLPEQHSIATYLDEKTSQIDSLISLKQEKIQELKDYKKSIIYEYVTGKKRV